MARWCSWAHTWKRQCLDLLPLVLHGFIHMRFHFLFPSMPGIRLVWQVEVAPPCLFFPHWQSNRGLFLTRVPCALRVGWERCFVLSPLSVVPSLWVCNCQRQEKGNREIVRWLFHLHFIVRSHGYTWLQWSKGFCLLPVNGTRNICGAALMNAPITLSLSEETGPSESVTGRPLCMIRVLIFCFHLFCCAASFFGGLPEKVGIFSGSCSSHWVPQPYILGEGRDFGRHACTHKPVNSESSSWKSW